MTKEKFGLWYTLSDTEKTVVQDEINMVLQEVDGLIAWLLGPLENRLEKVTVVYEDRTVELDFEGLREK